MRIAIVGSHVLTEKEIETADFILNAIGCRYGSGLHVLVSGGAKGIDTMAEEKSEKWGWIQPSIIHLPENKQWEPDGYKARNILIAQECDMLIRIASRNTKTKGSEFTANEAERLGKPTWRIWV